MVGQFGFETWIILANPSPRYLEFLERGGAKLTAHLPIHLHGPFNIFNSADMLAFRLLMSAITQQITKSSLTAVLVVG